MSIVSLHVTHRSAGGTECLGSVIPVLEREFDSRLSAMPRVSEYIIVRTCNRFEAYAVACDGRELVLWFEDAIRSLVPSSKIAYVLEDDKSVKHLFRVVCGLDSLIVGEDQIQHQIREAYVRAKEEGHVHRVLGKVFDKAMTVGKRVRTETALNKGAVSVGSAAVELAADRLGSLDGRNVTILGAGDMASVIAKNLLGKNIGTVFVSNRTYGRALELADELGGTAVSMDLLGEVLGKSDLVLVATSAPHTVLHRDAVSRAMEERPDRRMLVIDVCMPRNADADIADVPGVDLDTMDSLQSIAARNVERRTNEIDGAERIIMQEIERMDSEDRGAAADEIIKHINAMANDIRASESRIAVSHSETVPIEKLVDDLSRAVLNKFTNTIYNNLREASRNGRGDVLTAAAELFGMEDCK